jgi:tetratricopeptide (TPR) repeat protein
MTVTDLLGRAGQLLQVGDLAAAEVCAQEALALDPQNVDGWCRLGEVLRQAGRLGDAVSVYREAAQLEPSHVPCRTALGNIFRNMALPGGAIHWYGAALALRPDIVILHLNHLFVLPIVVTSAEQIEALRQRCLAGLGQLVEERQVLDFKAAYRLSVRFFLFPQQHSRF